MKKKFYIPLLIASVFALGAVFTFAAGSRKAGTTVAVTPFDVDRYLGTWYEIGSIPQTFQKGCRCSRATYTVRDDASIDVLNECQVGAKRKSAQGVAQFRGGPTVGDLWVSFFLWFKGSYRIIALDQQNYDWSLVSNDESDSLWILSRSPTMSDAQINALLEVARSQGVDVSRFTLQEQRGCTY